MKYREKKSVTLIELVVAITLLGVVMLSAVTIELAMRRLSVKPKIESKITDELIPIIENLRKDFELTSFGTVYDPGIMPIGSSGVAVRVGNIYDYKWHAYNWTGTSGSNPYELWYYPNYGVNPNFSKLASAVVASFYYVIGANNTSLSIYIEGRLTPALPANPTTNPSVKLNTTLYSRGISAL